MTMYSYFYVLCTCMYLLQLCRAHYSQQWAVHITGGRGVADQVATDHGFINLGEIFEDYYHFTHRGVAKRSLAPNIGKKIRLVADTRVRWAQQQVVKKRVKRDLRLQDSDPRWPSMWYLNRGNGLDMNVIPAWLEGVTGKGAVVTILDDGLEKDHPDLVQNYDPMASYDVNNHDSDPSPRYDMIDSNRHGTRCAGEVAATSNNSVCALGVAHGAQVGGVRMLDGDVTDAVEARSLSLNPQHIDIYSASWGPDDDGKTVDGPGELATRAFIEGVTKGRNGKGSIFVWASGNGGRDHDNCNCDGYTNSIYSLSISSATEQGHVPWYSEACSSTLASTYSSGAVGERQVVTTDLHHSCTSSHTGTSASAPLAAGICALALEANPSLTWRDMQHIVVRTARPQHLVTPDWQTNGVGRNVSHSFGYGLMDAYAMVQLARKWITVPEQHKCEITAPHVQKSIPAKSVVVLQLQVTECEGVQILEHVQAKLTIFSQRRGDLHIQLTSPMGTRVTLLAHRAHDVARSGFNHWPFMSVHSWGEAPFGTWQLEIHNDGRLLAEIQAWDLTLYGTSTPPAVDTNSKTNSVPSKVNVPAEEFQHNAVDVDSPTEFWRSDAEIRKDTSTLEDAFRPTNSAQQCAKSNGQFCLGLSITLILCYMYCQSIMLSFFDVLIRFLLNVSLFNISCYMKLSSYLYELVTHLRLTFLETRKFMNSHQLCHTEISRPYYSKNEYLEKYINCHVNRDLRKVKFYSIDSVNCIKITETELNTHGTAKDSSILKYNSFSIPYINTVRNFLILNLGRLFQFIYLRILEGNNYRIVLPCDMVVLLTYCRSYVWVLNVLGIQSYKYIKILHDIKFERLL